MSLFIHDFNYQIAMKYYKLRPENLIQLGRIFISWNEAYYI